MNNTNKITRKELFTQLLELEEVKNNSLWVEKLNAEIAAIEQKNANRKLTPQQVENESRKAAILSVLSETEGHTVTEIMKECAKQGIEFTSNQHCTALVRQLRLDGTVTRDDSHKPALFFKA